jgi:malonyl-CoA decarboxylase
VAIFYSISSTQPGLAGISLGGFLIKHVVDALRLELPRLRTFATLSPIPGFVAWLTRVRDDARLPLPDPDRRRLRELLQGAGTDDDAEGFGDLLLELPEPLRNRLLELCAHYLVNARRSDGRALDPVANFHLTNGARIERVNWLADRSTAGLRDSIGLMVNYLYELAAIEGNHEAYASTRTIAASAAVTRWAKALAGGASQR